MPAKPSANSTGAASVSDLEFIAKMVDKTAIDRLEQVASSSFKRCSYTEAIELLEKAAAGGRKFEHAGGGKRLKHKIYSAVFWCTFPFFCYSSPNSRTVYWRPLWVGELIGGSQREDRYDTLKERIEASGMDAGPYEQYLDIRKVSQQSAHRSPRCGRRPIQAVLGRPQGKLCLS
ncbi:hypothetical protein DUNSADRAFT_11105 [Dunaliella salina]|uniref:Encoded protein n=1 Tax=Dunaliella salina TaxID=3046 RepID=A0ABQ7H4K6_DUNSA|nr:hypothetical protein DUNSADRAFT_11105 [Dunaliella salina]|eukprot:KAF5841789.1 hypothetical protein DUNSADRAFT_11105 [Dunaliella salina]